MKAGFLGVTESMEKAVSPNRFNVTRVLALDTGISSMVRGMAAGTFAAPPGPGACADPAIGAATEGGGEAGGAGGAPPGGSVTSAGGKVTTAGGASDTGGGTSIDGVLPPGPDGGGGGAFEGAFDVGCAVAREDQPSRHEPQPSSHTNRRM